MLTKSLALILILSSSVAFGIEETAAPSSELSLDVSIYQAAMESVQASTELLTATIGATATTALSVGTTVVVTVAVIVNDWQENQTRSAYRLGAAETKARLANKVPVFMNGASENLKSVVKLERAVLAHEGIDNSKFSDADVGQLIVVQDARFILNK